MISLKSKRAIIKEYRQTSGIELDAVYNNVSFNSKEPSNNSCVLANFGSRWIFPRSMRDKLKNI